MAYEVNWIAASFSEQSMAKRMTGSYKAPLLVLLFCLIALLEAGAATSSPSLTVEKGYGKKNGSQRLANRFLVETNSETESDDENRETAGDDKKEALSDDALIGEVGSLLGHLFGLFNSQDNGVEAQTDLSSGVVADAAAGSHGDFTQGSLGFAIQNDPATLLTHMASQGFASSGIVPGLEQSEETAATSSEAADSDGYVSRMANINRMAEREAASLGLVRVGQTWVMRGPPPQAARSPGPWGMVGAYDNESRMNRVVVPWPQVEWHMNAYRLAVPKSADVVEHNSKDDSSNTR